MKLKVYVTLVKSMPGLHRVFSASSLDAPELCQGTVIATHRGHLRQWLYGGTEEKCQQVQLAIRVSLWARSKHLLMCDRVWWFALPWTRWWRDEVRDMVWHYITLTKPSDFLWKIAFECYDGLYQIVLQDSWLVQTATPMMSFIWKEGHFSEIHRSIAQAQRKQISNELFLCLHNPLLRKVLNDFRRYSLCGFTPEFQNQFTSQLTPTLAERHY